MIGFRMIMAYHCTTVKTSVELHDGVDMFGMLLGSVQYPTSSHIAGFLSCSVQTKLVWLFVAARKPKICPSPRRAMRICSRDCKWETKESCHRQTNANNLKGPSRFKTKTTSRHQVTRRLCGACVSSWLLAQPHDSPKYAAYLSRFRPACRSVRRHCSALFGRESRSMPRGLSKRGSLSFHRSPFPKTTQ